jgi:HK97 family phage prohead protease
MATTARRRLRMQVRATPEKGAGTGTAVVSTYDLAYEIGWGWTEVILPGCFKQSIAAHKAISIFYNHNWDGGPIGSGIATENGTNLTVDFQLYLDRGDLVGRVYQAMLDGALEEWSVGFWAEQVTSRSDLPQCDLIVQGDLAEASVCVRGANPETGTLELAGRKGWVMGNEAERKREVARLRARLSVRSRGTKSCPATPSCGHPATVHEDVDEGDNIGPCSTPGCDCPGALNNGGEEGDPGENESAKRAQLRLMGTPHGRRVLMAVARSRRRR